MKQNALSLSLSLTMVTEDSNSKKQKFDHPNRQKEDIDMVQKPSYAQVAVEGEEEVMSDQYWETIHAVANQALHDLLLDDEEILVDAMTDDIVEVELPRKDILKAFSMFHD